MRTFLLLLLSSLVMSTASQAATETAVVGGGCFWCTEAEYSTVPGVLKVTSGYAGGTTENPTYKQVCTGTTGHAEVIQIEFDPAKVSYEKIIDLFWKAHNPTTRNRQGNDEGTQYRSIILYQTDAQKAAAEKSKAAAQASFKDPIVTEIVPLKVFYPAEAYHQDYAKNNGDNPYVQAVVMPKLEHFKNSQ